MENKYEINTHHPLLRGIKQVDSFRYLRTNINRLELLLFDSFLTNEHSEQNDVVFIYLLQFQK